MSVQTPNQTQTQLSIDRIVEALVSQVIFIDTNEIVLAYVEKFHYSNIIRVILKNGTVISLDAENLQIYNIETPIDVVHRAIVFAFDRDE